MGTRDQRFCTFCGRRMVPFETKRYPEHEWLGCPRARGLWVIFADGLKHDVAIVGDRKRNFDPVTGAPIG